MTSSKRMEDLMKPLEVIRKFHFVIAPILTLASVLSINWAGELDCSNLCEKEFSILGYILGNIFLGWLWTYWISKSINTQQPSIKRIYLIMMLFLYILRLLGPIYIMLDFKFSFEISNQNMDSNDNMILETENQLKKVENTITQYYGETRIRHLAAFEIVEDGSAEAQILTELFLDQEITINNLIKSKKELYHHLTKLKSIKQKMIYNPRPSHWIVIFEKFCTAIFGILIIYNILQYYKMSSPEQNVNNFFRNKKIGKTITSKLKVRQPQKNTIGKR